MKTVLHPKPRGTSVEAEIELDAFEEHFVHGDPLDGELFKALDVTSATFETFLIACNRWSDADKVRVIIAAVELADGFSLGVDDVYDLDIELHEVESLRAFAGRVVDEGLYGKVPAALVDYVDVEKLAKDLRANYGEVTIAGVNYAYRVW